MFISISKFPDKFKLYSLKLTKQIKNCLPGRTDNEIKNYWNTYLRKKAEHKHDKIPSHNDNIPIKLRIESPGCSKNSFGNVLDPTKSPHPMRCTKVMMPVNDSVNTTNLITTSWDNHNPSSASMQLDDYNHCLTGVLQELYNYTFCPTMKSFLIIMLSWNFLVFSL